MAEKVNRRRPEDALQELQNKRADILGFIFAWALVAVVAVAMFF